MPQYELMYLLGSHVADDEVPKISQQVLKVAEDFGAEGVSETHLGKKKLAYPIKKTRNGYYVVVNFAMDSRKINEFDAKIRTMDSSIIRYLLTNLEEHLERQEKDKIVQSKMVRRIPPTETPVAEAAPAAPAAPAPKKETVKEVEEVLDINQEDLDKKIEAALNEDLTK